jgi:hypothetical protein
MPSSISIVQDDVSKKWIVAKNPRAADGVRTSRSRFGGRVRTLPAFVWDGASWSSRLRDAKQFDDRQAAEEYSHAHAGEMDS